MLALCDNLGVPVAMDKLENPASTWTFLGITLDTVHQELHLQCADKLRQISPTVTNWLGRCTAPKRELLSLIGKLAFAARVIPAGCLFCWWLFQLSSWVEKLHHHIYMSAEAREDLQWWHNFLPSWNGIIWQELFAIVATVMIRGLFAIVATVMIRGLFAIVATVMIRGLITRKK